VSILSLQGWGLVGRDMRHLQPLQQLRQLHVEAADPWLMEDSALLQLTNDMPALRSIIRDGRQLLHDTALRASAAAAAPAGSLEPRSHAEAQSVGWAGVYDSTSTAAAVTSGSSYNSIWAAGLLPDEADQQQQHEVPVLSPWLRCRVPQPLAHSQGSCVLKPGKHTGMQQGKGPRRTAAMYGGSSRTMYQRLSAYDERFRYTSKELLALRSHLSSEQPPQPGTVGTAAASTSSAGNHAGQGYLAAKLPLEIRSGVH
jgi:hypothetical protein